MNVNNQKEYQLHQIKNLFRFIGYVEKLDDLLELKKSTKFQDSKEFECIIFLCLEYANQVINRNGGHQILPKVKLKVIESDGLGVNDLLTNVIDVGCTEIYNHVYKKQGVNCI